MGEEIPAGLTLIKTLLDASSDMQIRREENQVGGGRGGREGGRALPPFPSHLPPFPPDPPSDVKQLNPWRIKANRQENLSVSPPMKMCLRALVCGRNDFCGVKELPRILLKMLPESLLKFSRLLDEFL